MSNFTVTVLDTTGIQPYIFGSNRLRENIGASYLVSQATDNWARTALKRWGAKFNQAVYAFDPEQHPAEAKPRIEDGELAAELVYAGGGNTVLLFSQKKYAIQFTKILSKRILTKAPGINLVAVHQEFDWDQQSLYRVVQDLMKNELDAKKRSRIPSAPLLGLSVTANCRSTQLVAVGMSRKFEDENEQPYLISREIEQKRRVVRVANRKLRKELLSYDRAGIYDFPRRIDHLGRSEGDSSYVAVVHADGNGMGERFQKFGKDKSNRDYMIAMRQLSHSVHQAGITALRKVVDILIGSIQEINGTKMVKGKFAIKDNNLPFRPLVYGGDDVTFVCDGRLGLELAAIYLEELDQQPIADGQPIKACAGICVVKTHYPFARAYQLSEDLCGDAKKYVKNKKQGDFAALDWHLAASGLSGNIGEIRDREYQVFAGNLAMRPVSLHQQSDKDWRTWEGFTKVVKHLNEDEEWKGRRNKVIALREVLRQGMGATQKFLKNYRIENEELPRFPEFSTQSAALAKKGWLDGICGYFDAIEAMEFYISLREESNANLPTANQATE